VQQCVFSHAHVWMVNMLGQNVNALLNMQQLQQQACW